jgi:anti-anti-sigma factor
MTGPSTDHPFELRVSVQRLGEELLLTVAGELDLETAPAVTATMAEHMPPTCRRIVIDASEVSFVDAAGLRALRAAPAGWGTDVETVIHRPSRPMRRILELTDSRWTEAASISGPAGNGALG